MQATAQPGRVEVVTADLAPATGVRTTRFCRTLKRRSSCAPAIAHEVQLALRPPWRADAVASTTSHSAFVTTRDRPSCWNGTAGVRPLIWGRREAKSCPSCHLAATRRAAGRMAALGGTALSFVIASEAKQSMAQQAEAWIASSLSLLAMTAEGFGPRGRPARASGASRNDGRQIRPRGCSP